MAASINRRNAGTGDTLRAVLLVSPSVQNETTRAAIVASINAVANCHGEWSFM